MTDYERGYREGVETALRHARVATNLRELIEGRLPALLAAVPEDPPMWIVTDGAIEVRRGRPAPPVPAPPATPACSECGGKGWWGLPDCRQPCGKCSAPPATECGIPYADQCRSCGGHMWITPLPSPHDNRTPPAVPCPACRGGGRAP